MNIINEAKKLGELTVGVLADAASIRYNRFPSVSLEERIKLVEVAIGYDANSKKYYLSVGNYEIKKSLTTKVERDFEFITYVFDMNNGTL